MKENRFNVVLKIILIGLLLVCLFDMPYGYYQLVRFLALFGFGYLGVEYIKNDEVKLGVIFVMLAILFQPFFKVYLGREIWNTVDVGVALLLSYTILKSKKAED